MLEPGCCKSASQCAFPRGLAASGIMLKGRGTADAAGKKAGKTKVRNTDQKAVLPCKDGVLPFLF